MPRMELQILYVVEIADASTCHKLSMTSTYIHSIAYAQNRVVNSEHL